MLVLLMSQALMAQVSVDSLRSVYQNSTDDSVRVNVSKILFAQYVYSKVDSAIYFAEQVVELARKRQDATNELAGTKYLGIAYSVKGDFEQSAVHMQQVLDTYLEAGDSLNIAYSYNNLGTNFLYSGNYLEAAEALLSAVRYKEALLQKGATARDVDLASTLLNIGIAYESQLDTAQAKRYYQNSIEEAEKMEAPVAVARAKSSLSSILLAEKDVSTAVTYLKEAETVFAQINDQFSLSKIYNNLALAHAELELGQEVIRYAQKGVETSRAIGNQRSEGLGLMYQGLGYVKTGQFREAIRISQSALELGRKLESLDIQQSALKNLHQANAGLRNYGLAYQYSLQYQELDEQIFSNDRAEQIERLSAQYEAEKREMEIENLNQENQLQSLELDKAAADRNLLLVFLLSAVLVIGLAVYFYRKISLSRKELRDKNGELAQLNKTKDRFFAIISHDLRGHISAFQNTGRLLTNFLSKNDLDKAQRVSQEIDKNASNVSDLLDNLLQWSVDQLEGYTPKPERLQVFEMVEELVRAYAPLAEAKGLFLKNEVDASHEILADKGSIFVTLRNLIANALKFTESGGVTISSRKEGDTIVLSVKDTGIGIPLAMQSKLYEIGEEKIRRGTRQEKGTGLGLHLAFEFTRMNRGELTLSSEEGRGTTFFVSLVHA